MLYKAGSQDSFVYFVLFGWIQVSTPSPTGNAQQSGDLQKPDNTQSASDNSQVLGHVSIGWTLGEEVLFSKDVQSRRETSFAVAESCLLGINK